MSARPRLRSQTEEVVRLGSTERDELWRLFERYYEGAEREHFEADLSRKHHVIVLRDRDSGALGGFSTVRVLTPGEVGRRCHLLYSGDTVVNPLYWGDKALHTAFYRYMVWVRYRHPALPLYWLLTTKGYRTYLLLTNYFRSSWPRYDRDMPPDVRSLVEHVGRLRYADRFDVERGVIRAGSRDRLRPGVADVTSNDLANPHIQYFAEVNPGHAEGDELLCLARIHTYDPPRILARLLWRRFFP